MAAVCSAGRTRLRDEPRRLAGLCVAPRGRRRIRLRTQGRVKRDGRPLARVPASIWLALAASLAAQIAWRGTQIPATGAAADLPPPPSAQAMRLASFGEPATLARLAMLYLQAF